MGSCIALPPTPITDEEVLGRRKLTEAVQQSVSRIHEDDLKREVLDWLASPEPATNFEMHRRKRLDSTGTWLLEGPSFRCWKGLPNSFLWVRGMRKSNT